MSRYLHHLSAIFFYSLAGSFFVAYLLHRNAIAGAWPYWWLSVMDMPLLLCGLLYSGTSLYRSLNGESRSSAFAYAIAIPFALIFLLALIVNYLPVQMSN